MASGVTASGKHHWKQPPGSQARRASSTSPPYARSGEANPQPPQPTQALPALPGGPPAGQAAVPPYGMQLVQPSGFWPVEQPVYTQVHELIINQVHYYFSPENLARDDFLRSHMDVAEGWLQIQLLATFNRLRSLTTDVRVIAR